MTKSGEPVRVTFELDRDISNTINDHVPWGLKTKLLVSVCKLLAEALDRDGLAVASLLMNDDMKLVVKANKSKSE
jgi:hypothetical protein